MHKHYLKTMFGLTTNILLNKNNDIPLLYFILTYIMADLYFKGKIRLIEWLLSVDIAAKVPDNGTLAKIGSNKKEKSNSHVSTDEFSDPLEHIQLFGKS